MLGRELSTSEKLRYRSPKASNWTGRSSTTKPEYWHEMIQIFDLAEAAEAEFKLGAPTCALLGYACDEGVSRNHGRAGAALAPKQIRSQLAGLANHGNLAVHDIGDIVCRDKSLEDSQELFSTILSRVLEKNIFPIAIGGGHDIVLAHFEGIRRHFRSMPKLGIINFDAHFDLRPSPRSNHSGSSFYQILSDHSEYVSYAVLGLRRQNNPEALFKIAEEYAVLRYSYDQCRMNKMKSITRSLSAFVEKNDWIYITIDLDCFSSAYAPGVSAPSPLGLTPDFVFEVLAFLFRTRKIISCDIGETNPVLDLDNRTSRLGALLIDHLAKLHSIHRGDSY